jgi:hypothetical protein
MPKERVEPISGWLLLCRDFNGDTYDYWHIAWLEVFGTKKAAISFAKSNGWPKPYRAVRGQTIALEHPDAS